MTEKNYKRKKFYITNRNEYSISLFYCCIIIQNIIYIYIYEIKSYVYRIEKKNILFTC